MRVFFVGEVMGLKCVSGRFRDLSCCIRGSRIVFGISLFVFGEGVAYGRFWGRLTVGDRRRGRK